MLFDLLILTVVGFSDVDVLLLVTCKHRCSGQVSSGILLQFSQGKLKSAAVIMEIERFHFAQLRECKHKLGMYVYVVHVFNDVQFGQELKILNIRMYSCD